MARILVIDDEAPLRELFRDILGAAGYEVDVAEDGQAGLDQFDKEPADLIITDMVMPEKDGFETIQEFLKKSPQVKIIAITGAGLENLPVAHDLGALRIFEKPVRPNVIMDAIKELLAE